MNSIVLAKGEKSKRLGINKAFVEIEGKKLIEVVLKKISPIFEKIYIVSVLPEKFEIYQNEKVKVVKDDLKCGPIGGIYIGLLNSDSLYNFVLPVDMPFINVDFLKYMIKIEKNYDVLVPYYKGKYEVLFAIYKRSVLEFIKDLIIKKEYKVRGILKKAKVKYIEEDVIRKFDDGKLFLNLNTKKDIQGLSMFTKVRLGGVPKRG